MSPRIAALAVGEELTDAATFAAVFSTVPRPERVFSDAAKVERITARAADPAALETEIDTARSRSAVTRLAVRLAVHYCEAAVLFLVHRGVVQGIAAEGCTGRPETALFPRAMPSAFSTVVARGESFRGAPPDRTLERRVLQALGREHVQEIAVLPGTVAGRVVTLLYADNGRQLISDGSLAALSVLGRRVGRAYERLILARKAA